jgi:hypothetical protein
MLPPRKNPRPSSTPARLDTSLITTDAPFTNKRAAIPGITAQLPNGGTIQSTHTCSLNLPFLPAAAREAHIFPLSPLGFCVITDAQHFSMLAP